MKHFVWIAAIIPAIAVGNAIHFKDHFSNYAEQQKDSERKTLGFSAGSKLRQVDLDNVDGSIVATGFDGDAVQLELVRTIRGKTKEDIELARKEVELQISEKNNRIELYVDGPFRCRDRSVRSRRRDYEVTYDFQLKVPLDCDLFLRTVNGGEIRVENVRGKFEIENVNGGVRMTEVAGPGRAHAINGPVKVQFSRNPGGDCSFSSLNGDVDVAFRQDLSADLWFKTFNGSAYTDYELVPLPQPAAEQERRDGKYVYRSNRFAGGRVGNGGPQIKFDTLNGNIHVAAR